jgi:hypothetical protein
MDSTGATDFINIQTIRHNFTSSTSTTLDVRRLIQTVLLQTYLHQQLATHHRLRLFSILRCSLHRGDLQTHAHTDMHKRPHAATSEKEASPMETNFKIHVPRPKTSRSTPSEETYRASTLDTSSSLSWGKGAHSSKFAFEILKCTASRLATHTRTSSYHKHTKHAARSTVHPDEKRNILHTK